MLIGKWYAFVLTSEGNLMYSESGHPTMLRSIRRQDVLCAGRFRVTTKMHLEVLSTSGALPNVTKKEFDLVEYELLRILEECNVFTYGVSWKK